MLKSHWLTRCGSLAMIAFAGSLVAGCDDPADPGETPRIQSVDINDEDGPIFRSLLVSLDRSAEVEVFYTPVDGGQVFRMTSDSSSAHDILLPRLLPERTYRYVVRPLGVGIPSESASEGTFSTGPLPDDLSDIDYSVEGSATFPLLVFNHTVDGGFDGIIAMQTDGEIVWYTEAMGPGRAATEIPGSHDMMFLSRDLSAVVRISPRGAVVDDLPFDAVAGAVHHDIALLDDSRVAIIARDTRMVGETEVAAEGVWIWNMETDEVDQVWTAWDYFDWETDRTDRSRPGDWLHANALSVGPRGNLIMSLHFVNQVISIAPDFQSLEWRLGGVNPTIGVAPEDQFTGQHSAWELPGNRVLMFDNNYENFGQPSRAVEFQIEGDSAAVIWEYVADPPLRSQIWSGVYELDNGNRVVSFPVPPVVQPPEGAPPFTVDEVTGEGQRVWRLTGPGLTATFRGVPWNSIAGEEIVAEMP